MQFTKNLLLLSKAGKATALGSSATNALSHLHVVLLRYLATLATRPATNQSTHHLLASNLYTQHL